MIQRLFVRESLTQVKWELDRRALGSIAKPVTTKDTKVHEGEPSIQKLRDTHALVVGRFRRLYGETSLVPTADRSLRLTRIGLTIKELHVSTSRRSNRDERRYDGFH